MVYVLDIGNTRVKGAVFEGNTLKEQQVFSIIDLEKNMTFFLYIINFFSHISCLLIDPN